MLLDDKLQGKYTKALMTSNLFTVKKYALLIFSSLMTYFLSFYTGVLCISFVGLLYIYNVSRICYIW